MRNVVTGAQSHVLTYKENNITKTVYIRKSMVQDVKRLINNYKKARKIFNNIIALNIQLLKKNKQK